MSNRWWMFLIILGVLSMLVVMPFLYAPTSEHRLALGLDASELNVAIIETKPLLDWTGRLRRYSLEITVEGDTKRYAWPDGNVESAYLPDAVEFTSRQGAKVRIPRKAAPAAEKAAIRP